MNRKLTTSPIISGLNRAFFSHCGKIGFIIIFREYTCIFQDYLPYLCRPKFEKMFAIVKIAGQQFKVNQGQNLYVPHLSGKQGDALEFSEVLLHSNENKVSTNGKVVVKAEIVNELVKGDKVIAFKMKRRKGFRKKHGHRTQYTQIKITEIA